MHTNTIMRVQHWFSSLSFIQCWMWISMDNYSVTLSRKVLVYLCYGILIILSLQSRASLSCAIFNYAIYNSQSNTIIVGWELRSDDHCPQSGPYNITVNRCGGGLHNLSTPVMGDSSGHIEVMINYGLCGSQCTVQFQGSEVCIMLLNISTGSKFIILVPASKLT